jgi:hypothetical protein
MGVNKGQRGNAKLVATFKLSLNSEFGEDTRLQIRYIVNKRK